MQIDTLTIALIVFNLVVWPIAAYQVGRFMGMREAAAQIGRAMR